MTVQTLLEAGYREPDGSDSFMPPEYTEEMLWLALDGYCGTVLFPLDVVGSLDSPGLDTGKACAEIDFDDDNIMPSDRKILGSFYNGEIQTVEILKGYGSRLSAPGYMDCTSWNVCDTAEQAEQALQDDYPDAFSIQVFRVRFASYAGAGITLQEYFETLPEARKRCSEVIRSRRATGHDILRISAELTWDISENEDSAMIPDTAGILALHAIDVYCN